MKSKDIRRILVVDDDESMCTVVIGFLAMSGYYSQSTTDPAQALSILEHDDFDLVISDIRMNGMDGLDLVREIGRKYPAIDTIIMSGFTGDYTYSDIIEAGASDFITKPFQLPELKAKLERIDRERKIQRELRELNIAMGVLLQRADKDKEKLSTDILSNLEQLILPYLHKLKSTRMDERQRTYLDILESNLLKITSPFVSSLSQSHTNLSHMEIQIANFIKAGKGNKEIAEILGVSVNTVKTHRYHLRTKLRLKSEKVNLKSYLTSINF